MALIKKRKGKLKMNISQRAFLGVEILVYS